METSASSKGDPRRVKACKGSQVLTRDERRIEQAQKERRQGQDLQHVHYRAQQAIEDILPASTERQSELQNGRPQPAHSADRKPQQPCHMQPGRHAIHGDRPCKHRAPAQANVNTHMSPISQEHNEPGLTWVNGMSTVSLPEAFREGYSALHAMLEQGVRHLPTSCDHRT